MSEPTLEQQHNIVLQLLGMSLDLENDLDRKASAVRGFWRGWPESRRQSVRALSSFLADAIEELCVVAAAREEAWRRRQADSEPTAMDPDGVTAQPMDGRCEP